MEKFRWAYIGCGGIAEQTAAELAASGEHEIAAVWNRTRERAERFAARFGGRVCSTVEEALFTPGVQGAYLAATADCRPEHVRACIRCRVPALCEKPFAVSAPAAKALLDEAAEAGVYLSEAMWTWHNAVALRVRDWVKGGRAGEITGAEFTYGYPLVWGKKADHRLLDPARLGGALLDIGIYPVRYCYELFGLPREVRCRGTVKNGVDLRETVELDYGGFTARLRVAMDRPLGERGVITGTEGRIVIPRPHAARRARLTSPAPDEIRDDGTLLYARQFSNVAAEIRAGRKEGEKIPAGSTAEVMALLDECRRQMGLVYPSER